MRPEETFVALVHHPVYDKHGAVVTTALTNLDLHDIARSCRTYGLAGYFVVHPTPSQQALAGRIAEHWLSGQGAAKNDFRRQALERIEVVSRLEDASEAIAQRLGKAPTWVATAARPSEKTVQYQELVGLVSGPALIVLGTGFGLTDELMARCAYRLAPVRGPSEYNHLSVRSACAIMLDRLYGDRQNHAP